MVPWRHGRENWVGIRRSGLGEIDVIAVVDVPELGGYEGENSLYFVECSTIVDANFIGWLFFRYVHSATLIAVVTVVEWRCNELQRPVTQQWILKALGLHRKCIRCGAFCRRRGESKKCGPLHRASTMEDYLAQFERERAPLKGGQQLK